MAENFPAFAKRTKLLLGNEAAQKLAHAYIAIFGLGAVGSYAAEALARSGVGKLLLVDFDTVKRSNINRQILALHSTLGQEKALLAERRLKDIHPDIQIDAKIAFAHTDTLPELLASPPDLVIDAIDSLNPKTALIEAGHAKNIPVYSAMGAATRLDADALRFGKLFDSVSVCPLARQIRKRLRRRGIDSGDIWCVWSAEPPNRNAIGPPDDGEYERGRPRQTLGSIATITGIFGLRLAHEVIRRLTAV